MKCLLSRVLRLKCYTASSPVFLTTKEQRISQTLGKIPFPTIGTITITVSGIEKQLRGLKADKAYGTDGVPPWFLKQNNQEISEFLTYVYQDCINTGTVPSQWKHVPNVCAIHKKGKKSDPSNYRPVSLTCIASKVLCIAMLWITTVTCRNMECSLITNMALGRNDQQKHIPYVPFMT